MLISTHVTELIIKYVRFLSMSQVCITKELEMPKWASERDVSSCFYIFIHMNVNVHAHV